MIRLIIRQFMKQWKPLLPVLLLWLVVGYFLFSDDRNTYTTIYTGLFSVPVEKVPMPPDRNDMLVWLSRVFTDLPGPGEERPEKAYDSYVKPALDRLKPSGPGLKCMIPFTNCRESENFIRLDLMEKACNSGTVRRNTDTSLYRSHWLNSVKHWNLEKKGSSTTNLRLVDPGSYWRENSGAVFESLRDLVNALSYAYEIPPSLQENPDRAAPLLIPELITRLSRAVCRKEVGILSWGDYAEFLETKAYNDEIVKKRGGTFDHLYPAEKEILLLETLKNNDHYIRALREYGAGPLSCDGSSFSISCYAPVESLKIQTKLLYFTHESGRAEIYLTLGRLHAALAKQESGRARQEHTDQALDFLSGASESARTEEESRMDIIRVHLSRKNYEAAYKEIVRLSKIMRNRGLSDDEFREMTRITLIGLGRFREADCFSPMSDALTGPRPGCADLDLR